MDSSESGSIPQILVSRPAWICFGEDRFSIQERVYLLCCFTTLLRSKQHHIQDEIHTFGFDHMM
jgi:hypothetical protein